MIDWGLFTLILVLLLLIVATCAGAIRIWFLVHELKLQLLPLPGVMEEARDAAKDYKALVKKVQTMETSVESVGERVTMVSRGFTARVSTIQRTLNQLLQVPEEDEEDEAGDVVPPPQGAAAGFAHHIPPPSPQPSPPPTNHSGISPTFGRRI